MSEYNTKTLQHGACTIHVHRPILTEAERTKREQAAKDTLGRVLAGYKRKKV